MVNFLCGRSHLQVSGQRLQKFLRHGSDSAGIVIECHQPGFGQGQHFAVAAEAMVEPEALFGDVADVALHGDFIEQEALQPAAAVCTIVPSALGEQIGDYAALCTAMQIGKE